MFAWRGLAFSIFLITLTSIGFAQDGVSTAGAARAKYLGNLGVLPASREVAVEDFVNYHRHEIGRPKAGEAVALDVRWGSSTVSREAILQVGLSTALASDRNHLRPLNLALVIDKSGSMAEANKLTRVKEALESLLSHLRPTDTLSLVAFDSYAEVLVPAQTLGDGWQFRQAIRDLQPGSATNLNAGLMLGYQEALRHYRKDATNRVVLLTYGIANQGVVDPGAIANASLGFNDRGIDLSTIGVGQDLNKDLLQQLAKSGRGLFHFVADSQDIQKVFANEVQSLMSPVATDPNLEIDCGPGVEVEKVYGYSPKISGNSVQIKLDNMNSGMTEVVLLRLKPSADIDSSKLPVKVRLTYHDLDREQQVTKTETAALKVRASASKDTLEDASVEKNYTIALLAQSIRDMAADCEEQQYGPAEKALNKAIAEATRRYPNVEDEDIKHTLSVAQKYQSILHQENVRRGVEADLGMYGANIIPNGDFSQGNVGFKSDLDYLRPELNSLWVAGYTVAPRFNSPQLHRLIVQQEFAAARRPKGTEQVYYANAGGSAALTLWTTTVRCKPHTKYRVRFNSISLTPGVEWIPTYEIRVNGERSEAQASSDGSYAEIKMDWDSKNATTATISIVRMPIPHGGGLIGISNIEMTPVLVLPLD